MKTKQIPVLIALAAGLITCIISFINRVSMAQFVKSLCLALVVFFVLGSVVRFIIDKNFTENKEDEAEEEETPEQKEAVTESEQEQ